MDLDEEYLAWLYSLVAPSKLKNPARTYWKLFGQLHAKKFVWLIPHDDNRVEDGRDLKAEFLDDCEIEDIPEFTSQDATMLELLISLARMLTFEAEGTHAGWFWHLLSVLGADKCTDAVYDKDIEELVDEKLEMVIWRRYSASGQGGLFPLRHSETDQRQVELWYQMNAYVIELND